MKENKIATYELKETGKKRKEGISKVENCDLMTNWFLMIGFQEKYRSVLLLL